jgi:hypothetical protein
MSMLSRVGRVALLLLALLLPSVLAGCGTSVGDECSSNNDCSAASMTCDLSAPGGYCLKADCWDDSDCPEDGVCIYFRNGDRYCMLGCSSCDDCRDDYSCIELPGQSPFCYVE